MSEPNLIQDHPEICLCFICATAKIHSKESELSALRERVRELEEGLTKSRRHIVECCCNAVEKLREVAPEIDWDDGTKTAEMYLRDTEALLSTGSAEG